MNLLTDLAVDVTILSVRVNEVELRQFFKQVIRLSVQIAVVLSTIAFPVFSFATRAQALGNPCALDPGNLIENGSMAVASPDNGVAENWNMFVLDGAPTFEHVDNEQIDPNGSQYIWEDTYTFDAGIYQIVTGLTPGIYYKFWLGYALAAYDPGGQPNQRNSLIGRQVGIDLTGDTNPSSSNVMWSNIYWNGTAAVNIPALSKTFAAQSTTATVFLRAISMNTNVRSKVWFDAVCMQALDPQSPPPVPSTIHIPMVISSTP